MDKVYKWMRKIERWMNGLIWIDKWIDEWMDVQIYNIDGQVGYTSYAFQGDCRWGLRVVPPFQIGQLQENSHLLHESSQELEIHQKARCDVKEPARVTSLGTQLQATLLMSLSWPSFSMFDPKRPVFIFLWWRKALECTPRGCRKHYE